MKYRIHKILFLIIGIGLFNLSILKADEQQEFSIENLTLAGQQDLQQCLREDFRFVWDYSAEAASYHIQLWAYQKKQKSDSLILKYFEIDDADGYKQISRELSEQWDSHQL